MAGQNAVPDFEPSNLRRLRQRAKLTQEELGARAGLPRHTVVQYENGHRAPYAARLLALADALGVAPTDLTSADGAATLAQLRIKVGLTQQAVAVRAGLVRTRYSAIERGEIATIDDVVVARIARALETTIDKVRTGHSLARAEYNSNRR